MLWLVVLLDMNGALMWYAWRIPGIYEESFNNIPALCIR